MSDIKNDTQAKLIISLQANLWCNIGYTIKDKLKEGIKNNLEANFWNNFMYSLNTDIETKLNGQYK